MDDVKHYNQHPKREASFIKPPNILKAKIGTGGLDERVLDRAQRLLEEHAVDFKPLADMYLQRMQNGIDTAHKKLQDNTETDEEDIAQILFPCVQLKSNGGMFHYPLVTRIADRFIQFAEVIETLDDETLEISKAFHSTIKIVVNSKIKGDGGAQGQDLVSELNNVCTRYFEKHPN